MAEAEPKTTVAHGVCEKNDRRAEEVSSCNRSKITVDVDHMIILCPGNQ